METKIEGDSIALHNSKHHPFSMIALQGFVETHMPKATQDEQMKMMGAIQKLYLTSLDEKP